MTCVILDTNTLLLFLVGLTNEEYINKHKRTDKYTIDNYNSLLDILPSDTVILCTPHVLAEVSNLIDYSPNREMKLQIYITFSNFVKIQNETQIKSLDALKRPEFMSLGLTDSALLLLASIKHHGKKAHLITADLDLSIAAEIAGYEVTNFNHIIDV